MAELKWNLKYVSGFRWVRQLNYSWKQPREKFRSYRDRTKKQQWISDEISGFYLILYLLISQCYFKLRLFSSYFRSTYNQICLNTLNKINSKYFVNTGPSQFNNIRDARFAVLFLLLVMTDFTWFCKSELLFCASCGIKFKLQFSLYVFHSIPLTIDSGVKFNVKNIPVNNCVGNKWRI